MGKKNKPSREVEPDVEKLMEEREYEIENINRIKKSIKDNAYSINTFELELRLEMLNTHVDKALELQSDIEKHCPYLEERAALEELCVVTKASLLELLGSASSSTSRSKTNESSSNPNRLPHINLPKFSGKYAEYKNFIGMFESLVNSDTSMTNVAKFNHLISCLTDEALGTVKAFQMTDENYPKALESLKRVYDNECLIFFDNIVQLFDLPSMSNPSSAALRTLVDSASAIYGSLLSIGDHKQIANAIIIHLVMSKVDTVTRNKWEEQLDYTKLPLWSDCELALNRRYQHMFADESSGSRVDSTKPKFESKLKKNSKSSLPCTKSTQKQDKCQFCKAPEHSIQYCKSFAATSVEKRFEFVKASSLCLNCLKKGHSVSNCKSSRCKVCTRPHHTLLHRYSPQNSSKTDVQQNLSLQAYGQTCDQPSTSRASASYASLPKEEVILATALVKIKGSSGENIYARALLDSGSQVNFITEELAQKLKLKKTNMTLNLTGIGTSNTVSRHKLQATVGSRINAFELESEFWVLKSISTCHPYRKLSTEQWNIPANLELADPYFYKPQHIDLLLGAESFFELLCVGQIKKEPHLPTLQKTLFGWIVSGKYQDTHRSKYSSTALLTAVESNSIDSLLERFWELEEIPNKALASRFTPEQELCQNHFADTHTRLPSGRFKLFLPFKSNPNALGLSFDTAKRRFLSLERRLASNTALHLMYMDFMKEYRELGHMELASDEVSRGSHYFIPHQCVVRPESTSTKLRVVFDASSKSTTQVSLNEILMVGPTIQPPLYSTLLRFRLNRYAITADITKMYRQIEIDESDRKFQLVLWREHANLPIQVYKLTTVTYGTSPAPFLAIRCLFELSNIYIESHPVGAKVIREDFYVDDLLTGAGTLEELETIRLQVNTILESAGFQLAKWYSNHPSYDSHDNERIIHFNDTESTKTLGIRWLPREDIFKFHLDDQFQDLRPTKRNILSVSARLFDPLGLLCPIVTKAKILLQELWLQKLDWDESIPMHLNTEWTAFKSNLLQLDSISIPRFVGINNDIQCQVHGFADASMRAYGCCIYIVTTTSNKTEAHLLTAKSKVAPLKTKSLPRLELCAVHLLSKLWSTVKGLLNAEIIQTTFWTDSEISLYWVKTHPSKLSTFVANRVSDIQENTKDVTWRHVPSKQNPADIVSRGCNVEELKSSIWFQGPSFLRQNSSCWPENAKFNENFKVLELRKTNVVLTVIPDEPSIIVKITETWSSYTKILRIVAYIYRFVKPLEQSSEVHTSTPDSNELRLAFFKIVESIQQQEFSTEIAKIKKSLNISPHLQKLNPFIHEFTEGRRSFSLLRVGGRLLNADIPYDAKFPLLLTKNSSFINIYIQYLHITHCHAGPKALVGILRQQIWLINAREVCSKVVRRCVHCFRYKPRLMTQIMGNLPADRITPLHAFTVCGVDYCGPVNVTLRIRGKAPIKMFIAVFVCFVTKAVHLELVSDPTSDCFILSLKRFIGRRGIPAKLYCDNATNFVGADRKLQELTAAFNAQRSGVLSYAAEQGIEFIFIPPRAPHFGGLWEAAVKSAKHHLLRTIGAALLTAEELSTLLVEIEAVLNSRPLSPLSSDPNDGEALTPGHFLVGTTLRSLPPESTQLVQDAKLNYLKRWQLTCALKQKFWKAWSRDYLMGLQHRLKWMSPQTNVVVGTLVIIHDDNAPPQQWMLGRIEAVVHGKDEKVRVVDVRTKAGMFRRPIHKLAPLPIP